MLTGQGSAAATTGPPEGPRSTASSTAATVHGAQPEQWQEPWAATGHEEDCPGAGVLAEQPDGERDVKAVKRIHNVTHRGPCPGARALWGAQPSCGVGPGAYPVPRNGAGSRRGGTTGPGRGLARARPGRKSWPPMENQDRVNIDAAPSAQFDEIYSPRAIIGRVNDYDVPPIAHNPGASMSGTPRPHRRVSSSCWAAPVQHSRCVDAGRRGERTIELPGRGRCFVVPRGTEAQALVHRGAPSLMFEPSRDGPPPETGTRETFPRHGAQHQRGVGGGPDRFDLRPAVALDVEKLVRWLRS